MSQAKKSNDEDTMLPEYKFDYSKAIRGRTAARLAKMGYPTMVMLKPEVAKAFPDSESVNDALQKYLAISELVAPVKVASSNRQRKQRRAAAGKQTVKA